jgi:predicted RNase H-like HicB family nuclease
MAMQRFRYLVVFEKAAHNYSAYFPELPGCVATGTTFAETRESMRGAMTFRRATPTTLLNTWKST